MASVTDPPPPTDVAARIRELAAAMGPYDGRPAGPPGPESLSPTATVAELRNVLAPLRHQVIKLAEAGADLERCARIWRGLDRLGLLADDLAAIA